jgi:GntR family transcriptional regulator
MAIVIVYYANVPPDRQMKFRIESDSHLPVYAQLKEQVKFLILNGELEPGAKLPTTRQLAGFLKINRNTVQKAYRELEQEGLIECRQGRGCVVLKCSTVAPVVSPRLLAVIDRAIEQAGEFGVGPDDFAAFAYARARQRRDVRVRRRLVFVECETLIVTALAQAIGEKLDVEVTPVLLQDLRQPTDEIAEQLRQAHLVATTFFHIQEVRRLLRGVEKEVVGLVVKPHLEKLIQIAQLPRGTPTTLVCCSESCALEMERSLENAGIKGLATTLAGVDDRTRLAEALAGRPVIIASDFVAAEVRPLLQPGQELVVLDYTALDEGAISLLRSMVTEEVKK